VLPAQAADEHQHQAGAFQCSRVQLETAGEAAYLKTLAQQTTGQQTLAGRIGLTDHHYMLLPQLFIEQLVAGVTYRLS